MFITIIQFIVFRIHKKTIANYVNTVFPLTSARPQISTVLY